jgi:quinol monooxygenase YgiN
MAYVVAAIWRAKEGQADTILRVIEKMTPLSRQESGCLFYQAHRSPTDPHLFFLYEQYVDAAGYEAHMATPHINMSEERQFPTWRATNELSMRRYKERW